jgi:hypothetical protein
MFTTRGGPSELNLLVIRPILSEDNCTRVKLSQEAAVTLHTAGHIRQLEYALSNAQEYLETVVV